MQARDICVGSGVEFDFSKEGYIMLHTCSSISVTDVATRMQQTSIPRGWNVSFILNVWWELDYKNWVGKKVPLHRLLWGLRSVLEDNADDEGGLEIHMLIKYANAIFISIGQTVHYIFSNCNAECRSGQHLISDLWSTLLQSRVKYISVKWVLWDNELLLD